MKEQMNTLSIVAEQAHCENCGLAVEFTDEDQWQHTDGYRACPPGFEAYASPEHA